MFIHLHTHSPFSFLDGASSLKELVDQAAELDMKALAITDHDNPVCGGQVSYFGCPGGHLILLAQGPAGCCSLCQSRKTHGRGNSAAAGKWGKFT